MNLTRGFFGMQTRYLSKGGFALLSPCDLIRFYKRDLLKTRQYCAHIAHTHYRMSNTKIKHYNKNKVFSWLCTRIVIFLQKLKSFLSSCLPINS